MEVYPESPCASPIIIFPHGRLLPPTFPTVPHLFPNPEHVQPRIDRASGLEISYLFCTMAYVFHTHQHMKLLIF